MHPFVVAEDVQSCTVIVYFWNDLLSPDQHQRKVKRPRVQLYFPIWARGTAARDRLVSNVVLRTAVMMRVLLGQMRGKTHLRRLSPKNQSHFLNISQQILQCLQIAFCLSNQRPIFLLAWVIDELGPKLR